MVSYFTCVFFLLFTRRCLSSEIESSKCKTKTGTSGFCRPVADCVGINNDVNKQSTECSDKHSCCPETGISKRKCYEYGEAVFVFGDAMPLTASITYNYQNDECGIVAVPLIIGGVKAQSKEFPHMAAIGFGNTVEDARWACGGSLISEFYILTAAHCLTGHYGKPRFVKLGMTYILSSNNEQAQLFSVDRIIQHPRYRSTSQMDDIALIKLNKRAELTSFVRPACLNYEGVTQQSALAAGWGVTIHGSRQGSEDLMKVELNMIKTSKCDKIYKNQLKRNISDSQLCFGSHTGGKDTCQGDSGGPLNTVRDEPYCMYSLIGITSFGKFCGLVPAIYTSVFYYVPWIESVVWPNEE